MLVFDLENRLHVPLTVFAAEAVKRSSNSTARVYVNAIAPFFAWLDRSEWQGRSHRLWNEAPDTIQRAIGDYLIERLNCKVREHHAGFQLVYRTGGTRTTARVFLSALKLFYRVMRAQDRYDYANPLVDGPSAVLAEIQERLTAEHAPPRMPQVSGVNLSHKRRLSDSYFKLVGESWVPQVIDDLEFPAQIQAGGRRIGWSLREQCIVRILFESGCRVSEVVGLSLADWALPGACFRRPRHSVKAATEGESSSSASRRPRPNCCAAISTRNGVNSITAIWDWTTMFARQKRTTWTCTVCRSFYPAGGHN